MKNSSRLLKNQRGQFVIEAVLLMTLSIGLFISGTKYLRDKKIVQSAVQGPWSRVSMMTEYGVWKPTNSLNKNHPNVTQYRGVTLLDFNR